MALKPPLDLSPLAVAKVNLQTAKHNLHYRQNQTEPPQLETPPEWKRFYIVEAEEAIDMWRRIVERLESEAFLKQQQG